MEETMTVRGSVALAFGLLALAGAASSASAQIAVSGNDNKVLLVNGVVTVVQNLVDGTVSVFTIQGKTVTPAGTVDVGGEKAGGGMVAITPDGKTALVSRSNDHKVSVLSIEGSKVEYTKRDMVPGQRPIVMDIASNGAFAVVASLAGGPTGDNDSISLIDLTAKPPRVVDTIGVLGATAEGLKIAPDSSVVAVGVHNGSSRAKDSP